MTKAIAKTTLLAVLGILAIDIAATIPVHAPPFVYQKCRDTPWLCQKIRLPTAW